ncbi:hypothetical protein [Actinomadura harenae]|uniref:Uncharacterized protein n=1 Tax=Actinomadura harenae TaxID=2483351 RepID=A0A3M2MA87_9ACTN|nr:hypothetical protein [Actinomadura harenae]RMI44038.1 hypothetical protein EBO15_14025 [Actinomadura harenae]
MEPPPLGHQHVQDDFLAALATTPFADDLILCGGILHNTRLGRTSFPADDFSFISHDLIGMGSLEYLKDIVQTIADGKPPEGLDSREPLHGFSGEAAASGRDGSGLDSRILFRDSSSGVSASYTGCALCSCEIAGRGCSLSVAFGDRWSWWVVSRFGGVPDLVIVR